MPSFVDIHPLTIPGCCLGSNSLPAGFKLYVPSTLSTERSARKSKKSRSKSNQNPPKAWKNRHFRLFCEFFGVQANENPPKKKLEKCSFRLFFEFFFWPNERKPPKNMKKSQFRLFEFFFDPGNPLFRVSWEFSREIEPCRGPTMAQQMDQKGRHFLKTCTPLGARLRGRTATHSVLRRVEGSSGKGAFFCGFYSKKRVLRRVLRKGSYKKGFPEGA